MSTALLVIDVQQVLSSGKYEVFNCSRTIDRINLIARNARNAKVPVVIIQHESAEGSME